MDTMQDGKYHNWTLYRIKKGIWVAVRNGQAEDTQQWQWVWPVLPCEIPAILGFQLYLNIRALTTRWAEKISTNILLWKLGRGRGVLTRACACKENHPSSTLSGLGGSTADQILLRPILVLDWHIAWLVVELLTNPPSSTATHFGWEVS